MKAISPYKLDYLPNWREKYIYTTQPKFKQTNLPLFTYSDYHLQNLGVLGKSFILSIAKTFTSSGKIDSSGTSKSSISNSISIVLFI